jgi:hypothetical protein
MRGLTPSAVYACERVREVPEAMARMARMLARMGGGPVQWLSDEELAALAAEKGWGASRRITGDRKLADPDVIFNVYSWASEDERQQFAGSYGHKPLPGFHNFRPWNRREGGNPRPDGTVCQTAWEIHGARGCLFKCDYCYFDNVLVIMLDVERFVAQLDLLVRDAPQTLYKYDNQTDILAFEPEYGASRVLSDYFAAQDRAFLMHYTKSDNVGPLLEYEHNGQVMVCWSLSAHTQSRLIEKETATCEQRIEAARRCQQAGYPVRFRFSPMVPVKGWREEIATMVELLFQKTRPDLITLQTLSRFPAYEMLETTLDLDLLDPEFVQAASDHREEMAGKIYGPLPHHIRLAMYRFALEQIRHASPETPVAICLESVDMWEVLSADLRQDPAHYLCACGPDCTPGHPLIPRCATT